MDELVISVRTQTIANIWGVRSAVYVQLPKREILAVYDEWDNCLAGSCRKVERVIDFIDKTCQKMFSEEIGYVKQEWFEEIVVRHVFVCPRGKERELERRLR